MFPAAKVLLEHIREEYGSIPNFCEAKNLDRFKVAKACKGELQRIDVDFALDVLEATGGLVKIEGWRTPKKHREARRLRMGAGRRIAPAAE